MSKKRFGSSSFLFLTAVLGMAGSAAVSATGNTSMRGATMKESSLKKDDLADLEDSLIEAEANTEKLLKLIALGLGITAGTVTIGGATYYFKDAENRQKFLQAVSNFFGKGKPGEAEIDKTIEVAEKAEEELKKDQVDEKNDENKATDQIVPGNNDENKATDQTVPGNNDENKATDQIVPGNADDNSNKGEINTDVPENSAEKVSEGNAFSNAVHDFYALRDKVLALLPIVKERLARSKASEETLGILDKYILFLGRDAFFGQTSFAVFKLLHLVLVVINFLTTFYNTWKDEGFSNAAKSFKSSEGLLVKIVAMENFVKPVSKAVGRLLLDFVGFVSPVVSVGELAYSFGWDPVVKLFGSIKEKLGALVNNAAAIPLKNANPGDNNGQGLGGDQPQIPQGEGKGENLNP